jgi:hypothetical protein
MGKDQLYLNYVYMCVCVQMLLLIDLPSSFFIFYRLAERFSIKGHHNLSQALLEHRRTFLKPSRPIGKQDTNVWISIKIIEKANTKVYIFFKAINTKIRRITALIIAIILIKSRFQLYTHYKNYRK